jgi:hypothetical protein
LQPTGKLSLHVGRTNQTLNVLLGASKTPNLQKFKRQIQLIQDKTNMYTIKFLDGSTEEFESLAGADLSGEYPSLEHLGCLSQV